MSLYWAQFCQMVMQALVCVFVQVDWDSEKECFDSFSREMSEFYAVKKSLFVSSSTEADQVSSFT